ncbi:hypothetical protein V5O48_016327 [Marasmius crinis-equi]|uniref:Uncharacterized protein n=1 Tax=Marasmius crinis-equi TaxID=585013 RepID=A0ABR3ESB6_9AGAR
MRSKRDPHTSLTLSQATARRKKAGSSTLRKPKHTTHKTAGESGNEDTEEAANIHQSQEDLVEDKPEAQDTLFSPVTKDVQTSDSISGSQPPLVIEKKIVVKRQNHAPSNDENDSQPRRPVAKSCTLQTIQEEEEKEEEECQQQDFKEEVEQDELEDHNTPPLDPNVIDNNNNNDMHVDNSSEGNQSGSDYSQTWCSGIPGQGTRKWVGDEDSTESEDKMENQGTLEPPLHPIHGSRRPQWIQKLKEKEKEKPKKASNLPSPPQTEMKWTRTTKRMMMQKMRAMKTRRTMRTLKSARKGIIEDAIATNIVSKQRS